MNQCRQPRCSVVGCTDQHKCLHVTPASEDTRLKWIDFIYEGNLPARVGKYLLVCASDGEMKLHEPSKLPSQTCWKKVHYSKHRSLSSDTCWSIKIRCRKDFLRTVNLFNLLWCARPTKITCTQTYGEKKRWCVYSWHSWHNWLNLAVDSSSGH